MSDPAVAPEATTPATPAAPEAPADAGTQLRTDPRAERLARAAAALDAAKAAARPAPEPAAEPAAPAEATQPQTASEVAAAREAVHTTAAAGGTSEDIARAVREAIAADRERHDAIQRARLLEDEQKRWQSERDAKLKDPVLRRMYEGATYEDVTREIVEGKLRAPTPEEQRLEALSSKLSDYEKALQRIEQEREQERRLAELGSRKGRVAEVLRESAEKYPWLGELPWLPEKAAHMSLEQGRDLDAVLNDYNAAIEKDALALFSSDRAISRAVANPEIRARLAKALGQPVAPAAEQKQTTAAPPADRAASKAPPRTVTASTASEPQARTSRIASATERKANAQRVLQQALAAKR